MLKQQTILRRQGAYEAKEVAALPSVSSNTPEHRRSSQVNLWIAKTRSSRCAEQKRPVPCEIRQMSASDAAQGKVIVNPESVTVFHGELR
jgi:hypothetical protein